MIRRQSLQTAKNPEATLKPIETGSACTGSTLENSEVLKDLKLRKVLHYKASLELSPEHRAKHYSEIVVNSINLKAERTLCRCQQTLAKIELLEARNSNLLSSTQQIDDLFRKLTRM